MKIECAICLNYFSKENNSTLPHRLGCDHFFHKHCMVEWWEKNKTKSCPTCNKDYFGKSNDSVIVYDSLVANLLDQINKSDDKEDGGEDNEEKDITGEQQQDKANDNDNDGRERDIGYKAKQFVKENPKTTKLIAGVVGGVVGGVAITAGLIFAAPVVVVGLGFTSAGIASGSLAASLMSTFGTTAVISSLQSIGALGTVLAAKGGAVVAAGSVAAGGVAGITGGSVVGHKSTRFFDKFFNKTNNNNNGDNNNNDNDKKDI